MVTQLQWLFGSVESCQESGKHLHLHGENCIVHHPRLYQHNISKELFLIRPWALETTWNAFLSSFSRKNIIFEEQAVAAHFKHENSLDFWKSNALDYWSYIKYDRKPVAQIRPNLHKTNCWQELHFEFSRQNLNRNVQSPSMWWWLITQPRPIWKKAPPGLQRPSHTESPSGWPSITLMVRTHTLDLTPDAPRSQLTVTIQLLIKDKRNV